MLIHVVIIQLCSSFRRFYLAISSKLQSTPDHCYVATQSALIEGAEQIASQKRTVPIVAVKKSPLLSEASGTIITNMLYCMDTIFTRTLGTFSNQSVESVPNRRALASQAPSLAPPIAPQACPQMSRDHRGRRSDLPEFVPICEQPRFKLNNNAPFVREHQSLPAGVAPAHSASQHETRRPSFRTPRLTRCKSYPGIFESNLWKYTTTYPL